MPTINYLKKATPLMKVTTLPGIVENGQIRLADNVRLPENATVYVVIPGVEIPTVACISSPRLAHPEEAVDFRKVVVEEIHDAGV
jgi:hypothetical protein